MTTLQILLKRDPTSTVWRLAGLLTNKRYDKYTITINKAKHIYNGYIMELYYIIVNII